MNVLFINLEDTTPAALHCYGNRLVFTPNLDRLAATGVRFDRAFCQYPLCNPSRSSYLSGLRPETLRIYENPQNIEDYLPTRILTLPELMENSGRRTACVGKTFHARMDDGPPQLAAFGQVSMCKIEDYHPREFDFGDGPEPMEVRVGRWLDRYGVTDVPEEEVGDARISRIAVRTLEEFAEGTQPFFLAVGSLLPHIPLLCPRKYIDLYDPAKVPLPGSPRAADRGIPPAAYRFGRDDAFFVGRTPSDWEVRRAVAAYYACVTFVDRQLGLILDTLERRNLAEKTIVVFTADHGVHLGEHGLWCKLTLFEQSTRVPLIIRVPGAPATGRACGRLVELVDLMPTLCELTGMDIPAHVEGTSAAPLLADPERSWKRAAFSSCVHPGAHGRTVRTEHFRYTEWDCGDETARELYDLDADPGEQDNHANKPEWADAQTELGLLLKEGWKGARP